MSRPTNKKQLINAAELEYQGLLDDVTELESSNLVKPGVNGDWSVKDVLAHLHEWHNMMNTWYVTGMKGQEVEMPAPGYSWKTTPDLNEKIYASYKSDSLSSILKKLATSHKKMIAIFNKHSDKELFTKKKYAWTRSTSMGAYLISSTSSHYDWARKLIKKWKKTL